MPDRGNALRLATDNQTAVANGNIQIVEQVQAKLLESGLQVREREPFQLVVTKLGDQTDFVQQVEDLKRSRDAARAAKNFAEADRIRAELDAMGIALKDAKDPKTGELVTTWEVRR